MVCMGSFEHLLKSYDVADQLDDIASSDPPAYLHRCFAEGISSFTRVQQLSVCAMVLDSIVNDRDYEGFEPELMSDWRVHFAPACARFKDTAVAALRRALDILRAQPADADAAGELEELQHRLAAA